MPYFVGCLLLLAQLTMMADVKDFNGRWNLKVKDEPRTRVWWLEVEGAGTKSIRGSFVGAPGGNVDTIPKIWVEDNGKTLVWQFEKHYGGPDGANQTATYRARIAAGLLEGTATVPGVESANRVFTGKRAPVIKDIDDGSWHPAPGSKPIELFNGRDLTGWRAMVPGKDLGWSVRNPGGILANSPGANNLVSEQKFWNFQLHTEFRIFPESNSGIGLRGRYEVQILEDFGKPPETHGMGALYARKAPTVNAGRGPGVWQTLDIRLIGRFVTVVLNDVKVIDKYEIPGLTAIANDADEDQPGSITIQGDHRAIEFRHITITPLVQGGAR